MVVACYPLLARRFISWAWGCLHGPIPRHTADGKPLLPHWWLFFLPLYWFPPRVCWGLIETYLIPFQVEAIVGDARKHRAFAQLVVSSNIGSFMGPIWGSISDSCVSSEGRSRRRPMIVIGQSAFCLACAVLAEANDTKKFVVLFVGYVLFTFTATVSGAPYTAVFTTVPTEQRGLYNSLDSWQSLFVQFIVAGLGVLIGEKVLPDGRAYLLIIVLSVFPTIPLGLMGLGESPGWWSKEPIVPRPNQDAVPGRTTARARPLVILPKIWTLLTDFVKVRSVA
jgi:Na+/melibiose symporter-like transporter